MVIVPYLLVIDVGQEFAKAERRPREYEFVLKEEVLEQAIACNSDTWKTILQV